MDCTPNFWNLPTKVLRGSCGSFLCWWFQDLLFEKNHGDQIQVVVQCTWISPTTGWDRWPTSYVVLPPNSTTVLPQQLDIMKGLNHPHIVTTWVTFAAIFWPRSIRQPWRSGNGKFLHDPASMFDDAIHVCLENIRLCIYYIYKCMYIIYIFFIYTYIMPAIIVCTFSWFPNKHSWFPTEVKLIQVFQDMNGPGGPVSYIMKRQNAKGVCVVWMLILYHRFTSKCSSKRFCSVFEYCSNHLKNISRNGEFEIVFASTEMSGL